MNNKIFEKGYEESKLKLEELKKQYDVLFDEIINNYLIDKNIKNDFEEIQKYFDKEVYEYKKRHEENKGKKIIKCDMNNLDKQHADFLQDVLKNGVIKEKKALNSFERENYFAFLNNYTEEERMEMNPNATDEDVHLIMDECGIPKFEYILTYKNKMIKFYE
jgi:hypothetical protein